MPPSSPDNQPVNPAPDQPAAPPPVPPPANNFQPQFQAAPDQPQPLTPEPAAKGSKLGKLTGPRARMLVFALAFAGIGGYIILHSFAASVSNEATLLNAFKKLGSNHPKSLVASGQVTYKGATFQQANLSSTTKFDDWGSSDTSGRLTVSQAGRSSTAPSRQVVFPFGVRNFGGGATYFRMSNTPAIKTVLPTGSNLRQYLTRQSSNYLSRLENNWYYVYYDDQQANKAPGADGLGCLVSTSLVPNSADISSMVSAYGSNPPITITKGRPRSNQTTYTIKASDATKLGGWLSAISGTDYVKGLNSCGQLIGHSNASDKLSGAIAANNPVITVTLDGRANITNITYASSGQKSSVNLGVSFNYSSGGLKNVVWPDPSGDFNSYVRNLVKPNNGEDNKYFSYTKPASWTADYCVYYDSEYENVSLYPDGTPKGPYCGYLDSRAGLYADVYQYDFTDEDTYADPSSNTKAAKVDKATETVANKNPEIDRVASSKNDRRAGIPANAGELGVGGGSGGTGSKCTETTYTDSTIVVDGKTMNRTDYVTGTCDKAWTPVGTKGVWIYYNKDVPSGTNTGTFYDFGANYSQKPSEADKLSEFLDMLKTVKLKF